MIENLNGLHENVNFKKNTVFRLYDNHENEGYPTHWHVPMEIIIPYKYDYNVTVINKNFVLDTQSILFVCPGVLHSIQAPKYGNRIIFQVDLSMFQNIKSFRAVLNLMSPCFLISEKDNKDIYQQVKRLLSNIEEEYEKETHIAELNIYSYLFQMFALIGDTYLRQNAFSVEEDTDPKKYQTKFLDVCNYINENCTQDLTLDKISSYAGFSKYHFSRLFKDFTGITFYKYLNQKRISYAQNLLLDPDESITDIAYRSGFESMSSFIRMFKIFNECTPSEYRSLHYEQQQA